MLLSESAKLNDQRKLPLSQLTPSSDSKETRTSRLQNIYRRKKEFSQPPYCKKATNPNKFVESFHLNLYEAEISAVAESLADLFGVHDTDPSEKDPSVAHDCLLPKVEAIWDRIIDLNRRKLLDRTGLSAIAVVVEEVLKDALSSYRSRMREIPEVQWPEHNHPILKLSEEEAANGGYAYAKHLSNCFTSAAANENDREALVEETINQVSFIFGGEKEAVENMVRKCVNDYLKRERSSFVDRFRRLSLSEKGIKKRKAYPNRLLAIGFARRKNFIGCPKFIREIRKKK